MKHGMVLCGGVFVVSLLMMTNDDVQLEKELKHLLGGANAANVVEQADDANNALTSEARNNSANVVLAARAEERHQKMKDQQREFPVG